MLKANTAAADALASLRFRELPPDPAGAPIHGVVAALSQRDAV
jgi:hypothetical protein